MVDQLYCLISRVAGPCSTIWYQIRPCHGKAFTLMLLFIKSAGRSVCQSLSRPIYLSVPPRVSHPVFQLVFHSLSQSVHLPVLCIPVCFSQSAACITVLTSTLSCPVPWSILQSMSQPMSQTVPSLSLSLQTCIPIYIPIDVLVSISNSILCSAGYYRQYI